MPYRGYSGSRRSEGSVTEGSVKGSVFRKWFLHGEKRVLHAASSSYLEGQKAAIYRGNQAFERRRPTEAADGLESYRMREASVA